MRIVHESFFLARILVFLKTHSQTRQGINHACVYKQDIRRSFPVNSLRKRAVVFLLWLGAAISAPAEELPMAESPLAASQAKAPASGVLDSGGFLSRNPEAVQRISDRIQKLDHDHGYKIYLVIEPVLLTSSAPELAAELRQAWVPDGNGMVVVFESDSRKVGVGRDLTSNPIKDKNTMRLPSNQINAILERAMAGVDSRLDPEPFLEALIGNLGDEVDDYFQHLTVPPPAERSVKLGLLIAGGLALLGLVAIALGGFVRYSSMASVPHFRFPVVDRPERLGAPCGSNVTARRFAPPRTRG